MKNVLKNIAKSFLFLSILILLVETLTFLFLPGQNSKKYGLYKVAAYEILGEDEGIVDVIATGDSLVYSSLSPMEIWKNHGYTVFDCAGAAQIISDTYDVLKVAVESQHPKIVLMEANVLFRDPTKKKAENKYLKQLKYYFPIYKYHDNWKKYISFGAKKNWANVYKGYKFINKVEPSKSIEYMSGSKAKREILKGNLETFDNIVKLCEENNIKLVLVAFPTQSTWSSKKHNSTQELADKYQLDFLDLNLVDLGIDWETDTKDAGNHLNYKGAIKVSKYVGNYLESTNLLKDHRDDQKYNSYRIAYKGYYRNHKELLDKVTTTATAYSPS